MRLRRRSPRPREKAGIALAYHRVGPVAGDPRLELVPATAIAVFEQHLRYLSSRHALVRASELAPAAGSHVQGEPAPVALTFDDDLRSHVELVAPRLRDAGVDATFFLCGVGLDGGTGFWWDDLQHVVDSAGTGSLRLSSMPELDLARAAQRPGALHEAAATIEALPPARRDEVAEELRSRADEPPESITPTEVTELAAAFEIGFHTRRHYLLTTLDDRSLDQALTDGRDLLESAAGRTARTIAYPHGKADHRVADAAREAGFDWGFTASARPVSRDQDPLLLGRVDAGGLSLDGLARAISMLLGPGR